MSQIETGSVIVVDFQQDLRLAANELAELEDELDRMSPIGRDTDAVHAQINEIKASNASQLYFVHVIFGEKLLCPRCTGESTRKLRYLCMCFSGV